MRPHNESQPIPLQDLPASYEPPRVELVLTPEDLQREWQHAGLDARPLSP